MCDNWIAMKNVTRRASIAGGFFVGVIIYEQKSTENNSLRRFGGSWKEYDDFGVW
jgi:hypothetical protein|tara:strand:+ start:43 stop:207 length:165 start_codon:yes stop_codon:yes gene_type:complete